MEYLKRKNKLFFDTVRELISEKQEFQVQLWTALLTEDDYNISFEDLKEGYDIDHYYDLVVVNFYDEEGYERSITIPLPIIFQSRSRGAKMLREWLKRNMDKIVYADRECYQRSGFREPITDCDAE